MQAGAVTLDEWGMPHKVKHDEQIPVVNACFLFCASPHLRIRMHTRAQYFVSDGLCVRVRARACVRACVRTSMCVCVCSPAASLGKRWSDNWTRREGSRQNTR